MASDEYPVKAVGWAEKTEYFSRRATGEHDVQFKMLYCGICHGDLHMIKNDLGMSRYPVVPGHEIVGVATEVGSKVKKINVGDKVGAGFLQESCRSCEMCTQNTENHCPNLTLTFGSTLPDGSITYGAVKFAKAFGAKVTVIGTSESKKKEAIEKLGADGFLISADPEQMQAAAGTMNGIIDTVSAAHPLMPLINLLKTKGNIIMVGAPDKPLELNTVALLLGGKSVIGSGNGGIKETQEMLDFAAEHNVVADVEVIRMD
ncbi:OLC1v1011625C1 [Oldenlandia corymbosa var. corymbosa]|uniref:OLC1v1011625C1 n=1 Tax=Oldenlandia corymbosa var. corymbosa TaxID=529605 RepID=A0AAV1DU16_OLDCO|nr:OLC1v1011625C1 [Oldenlandia corymbosa var. corymbosa]